MAVGDGWPLLLRRDETMQITVTDRNGEQCPNLVGVFRREFPVAVGNAKLYGSAAVYYYGERYVISFN